MDTADGAVFVKQASGEAGALSMLRREALVYSRVSGSFLPACVGFADRGDCALLALEYLSADWWPPPYPDDATPLFATLGLVASTKPPEDLPAEGRRWSRWQRIAEDPEPLLGLRLCSRNWLEHSLEALIAAEARARFRRGRARPQRRLRRERLLYESRRGAGRLGSCGAWLEVGRRRLRHSERPRRRRYRARRRFSRRGRIAAALAGHFAYEAPAPLPDWADPGSTLREDMAGDLEHALAWAAEELGFPSLP